MVGIFVACLLLEAILQITDLSEYNRVINDSSSGLLTYRPNKTFHESDLCFDNKVFINNMGFHGPDVFQKKAEKCTSENIVIG